MDGILLIDKPAGITSHDVVDRVRRIFHTRRVGHAGTLDPFATGLLIVGVGPATKTLASYVGLDKTYVATARLGATSTTDDPEGVITERPNAVHPSLKDVDRMLASFVGTSEQLTPVYSAKKVGGKKMYELARAGKADTVERPKKLITISDIRSTNYDYPFLTFEVSCSSGTYIRAIARDLGEKLGCGAYLTALRRTRIGTSGIEEAVKLEGITPPASPYSKGRF